MVQHGFKVPVNGPVTRPMTGSSYSACSKPLPVTMINQTPIRMPKPASTSAARSLTFTNMLPSMNGVLPDQALLKRR